MVPLVGCICALLAMRLFDSARGLNGHKTKKHGLVESAPHTRNRKRKVSDQDVRLFNEQAIVCLRLTHFFLSRSNNSAESHVRARLYSRHRVGRGGECAHQRNQERAGPPETKQRPDDDAEQDETAVQTL